MAKQNIYLLPICNSINKHKKQLFENYFITLNHYTVQYNKWIQCIIYINIPDQHLQYTILSTISCLPLNQNEWTKECANIIWNPLMQTNNNTKNAVTI